MVGGLSLIVFDPHDRASSYFPGDLFSDGVNFSLSQSLHSMLVGRATSYAVTANYSAANSVNFSTLPLRVETTEKSGAYTGDVSVVAAARLEVIFRLGFNSVNFSRWQENPMYVHNFHHHQHLSEQHSNP